MKPKVLIISGVPGTGTEIHRCIHASEELELAGIFCTVIPAHHAKLLSIAALHDIIILQRVAYSGYIERLMGLDKIFVFDVDDLVFDPSVSKWVHGLRYLAEEEIELYNDGIKRYRETLLQCDYGIYATDYLAEKARETGQKAFTVRNAIGMAMVNASVQVTAKKDQSKIIVGYISGTKTHDKDFLEAADALLHLLDKYKNLELMVQGYLKLDSRFNNFKSRIKQYDFVPWNELYNVFGAMDINIAPSEPQNPYCRAKSEIKYLEAGLVAVPTVASRIDSFSNSIRHKDNGLLANGKDEWVEALESLIADASYRVRMGRNAKNDVYRNHLTKTRSKQMEHAVMQIWAEAGDKKPSAVTPEKLIKSDNLKIVFLITTPFKGSGGHMTIFRNIKYLEDFGHKVIIYVAGGDVILPSGKEMREYIRQSFIDIDADVYIGWDMIEECDAMIATYNTSAPFVSSCNNAKKKFFFVQDFEPSFYPMGSDYIYAENTYKLDLSCISIGRWLAKKLEREFDADTNYFDFAVDTSIYYPRCEKTEKIRIAFYAQPDKPRRGFDLGVDALEKIYRKFGDTIEIVLFGSKDVWKRSLSFPYIDGGVLTSEELALLYSSSHIGFVISLSNPSLIPFDMMACGCAVVDILRENNLEDYMNGQEIILAEANPNAMARAITELVENRELRDRIVDGGKKLVSSRSYEQSARKLEALILQGIITGSVSKRREVVDIDQPYSDSVCGEIANGTSIGQTFVSKENNLCGVELAFATYQRTNVNDAVFRVKEEGTSEDYHNITIPGSEIHDNQSLKIMFPPIKESKGKRYEIHIESESTDHEKAFTLYMYKDVGFDDCSLLYNSQRVNGSLKFKTFARLDNENEYYGRYAGQGV